MKMRLASKFSPRTVAEIALIRFSLTRILGSFFNNYIISSAPVLMDSFCTCASFWFAEAYICSAIQREVGSWEQKMILRSVICPPSLYRVEPLSSESSNSCNSSKSPRTSSASFQRKLSRADKICWMRLISELVYCCIASSSHFLSWVLIYLNQDFLVPSVYFSENFSRPYQSIIVFYLYQSYDKVLYYLIVRDCSRIKEKGRSGTSGEIMDQGKECQGDQRTSTYGSFSHSLSYLIRLRSSGHSFRHRSLHKDFACFPLRRLGKASMRTTATKIKTRNNLATSSTVLLKPFYSPQLASVPFLRVYVLVLIRNCSLDGRDQVCLLVGYWPSLRYCRQWQKLLRLEVEMTSYGRVTHSGSSQEGSNRSYPSESSSLLGQNSITSQFCPSLYSFFLMASSFSSFVLYS